MIDITLDFMRKARTDQPHEVPEATWGVTPSQRDADVGWTGTMLACRGREGHG